MNFLCDTNIVSEVMKKLPNQTVKNWLNKRELIYLSVITIEEIYCGLAHKDARRQKQWFEKFVKFRCEVLPITSLIAVRCGIMHGNFRKQGIIRTQADLFIAATVYEHGLTLVTRNTCDFKSCNIQVFNPFLELPDTEAHKTDEKNEVGDT
jgi:toxin FitB